MNDKISIIIPVYNEEKNILACARSAAKGENVEIIVVDGGSEDKTLEIARAEGLKTLVTSPGRAFQMNGGAEIASGRHLLFLHADTILPPKFDLEVRRLMGRRRAAAGAFLLKTDYNSRLMRVVERLVALRSKWFGMPYGDQGIFMRKETFLETGGFPEIPVMEDFAYMKKLGKHGEISISSLSVMTSARRWRKSGIIKNTLTNQILIAGHLLGVSPSKLQSLRSKLN